MKGPSAVRPSPVGATATCVAAAVLLLSAACSSTEPASPDATGLRDALTRPYPADAIWNHPRGAEARLVPFPLSPTERTLAPEEDIIIDAPDAAPVDVYVTTAGWDPTRTRCGSATDEVLVSGLPIPSGWTTDPGYVGTTPNQSAAVVMPDDTLVELQPFHVCPDGRVVAQYAPPAWRGSSILTGGVPDAIGGGAHGGSGLTAFGGTIRLGEWVPGGSLDHALKVTVDGAALSATDGGFRWPADRADASYAADYTGSVAAARMGALLTLPADFDVDTLATEPARMLARALVGYGAYVVDDAGRSAVGLAVEWGPQGRVLDEFEQAWGYSLSGRLDEATGDQQAFLADVAAIEAALHVVDDNAPTSVGGAGDPLAAFAAPLARTVGASR